MKITNDKNLSTGMKFRVSFYTDDEIREYVLCQVDAGEFMLINSENFNRLTEHRFYRDDTVQSIIDYFPNYTVTFIER